MGLEANCSALMGNQISDGKLQWETDVLLFRGTFRLKIPAGEITRIQVAGQDLVVEHNGVSVSFLLGAVAAKWCDKILHPPTLFDKLGIKKNQRVALVNWKQKQFCADLQNFVDELHTDARTKSIKECDVVFLGAERDSDLLLLAKLEPLIKRNGAIWIVYPKGQKLITEASVMAETKRFKLVDNKTCRFSETHTGLRAVIPVARR